jgi:histone chaperone ASF1
MIYVGSADSEAHDQVLGESLSHQLMLMRLTFLPTDSVLVGPVHQGSYRFVFEGNPPDPSRIPVDDLLVRGTFLHGRNDS